MLRPKPTAIDVRTYREEKETSIFEAKDALMKQWRRAVLEDIKNKPLLLETRFNGLLDLIATIPGF